MSKKHSFAVEFRCDVCNEIPPKDAGKSNKNWAVYPSTCPADGGRVTGRMKDA